MSDVIQPKRKLKVDMDELAAALDDASDSISRYLDLETGELVLVTYEERSLLNDIYEELEEVGNEEDAEFDRQFYQTLERLGLHDWQKQALKEAHQVEIGFGTRFESVPRVDSHEGYRDMEDFIDSLANQRLAELLSVAINGRGAFRRFKDVLARYPREREQWFQFQNQRLRQRALEWLAEIEVQPE